MSIGKKTRSSLYWTISLKLPTEVIRFAAAIVVARLLGPYNFGVVAIGQLALSYSNQLSSFGFGNILVQREQLTSKHINTVFVAELSLNALMALVVCLAASPIARFFDSPESEQVIRALSLYLLIRPFHDIPNALLRRHLEFKFLSIFTMIEVICGSALTLLLAFLGFEFWALVFGLLIARVLLLPIIIIRSNWRPHLEYDHAALMEMADFGVWNFIRAQLHFINSQFPNIAIGRFAGPITLGLFERAFTLSQTPLSGIAMPLNSVMFSAFSRGQTDREQLRDHFRKAIMASSLIMYPTLLGLAAVSDHFVIILLGDDWAPMSTALEILCFATAFLSFGGMVASLNIATGKFRAHTLRLSIGSAALIALTILLAPKGLAWLAIGVLLYGILVTGLTLQLALRTINMSVRQFAAALSPALPAAILMYLVTRAISLSYLDHHTILNLSVLVILGVVCYGVAVFIRPNEVMSAFFVQVSEKLPWIGTTIIAGTQTPSTMRKKIGRRGD